MVLEGCQKGVRRVSEWCYNGIRMDFIGQQCPHRCMTDTL
jgi:hypothetical protein